MESGREEERGKREEGRGKSKAGGIGFYWQVMLCSALFDALKK